MTGMILACSVFIAIHAQPFEIQIPNDHFEAEAGTGIDTRLKVTIHESSAGPVYLSSEAPESIGIIIQPDTVFHTDTVVLSVMVSDSSLSGQKIRIGVNATDKTASAGQDIYLKVVPGNLAYLNDQLARTYRDSAIQYLLARYPGPSEKFGNLPDSAWSGFYPYPPLDIVSHYVYLTGNWRINVLWHVMVPPYDWKKIYIYNEEDDFCRGINIDTEGICTEIPCEKYYYFYQDTFNITNIPVIIPASQQSFNFPNPFSQETTITFPNTQHDPYTVYLFDANGRRIKRYPCIRDDHFVIHRGNLSPGVYLYQIIGKHIIRGKMILY